MAFFDFHGDKFPVLMEWPGPQDGILCRPKKDGSIDGTRLFGTADGFENGYEALRTKDINNDGKISGAELGELAVWTDANSDARPQAGEVKSLSAEGVLSLGLKTFLNGGNSFDLYTRPRSRDHKFSRHSFRSGGLHLWGCPERVRSALS